MTYALVSRLENARAASEQHCSVFSSADIEIFFFEMTRGRNDVSLKFQGWTLRN